MEKFNLISKILSLLLIVFLIALITASVFFFINGADPKVLSAPPRESKQNVTELAESYDYGDGYLKSIVFICDRTLTPISDAVQEIDTDQIWTGTDGTLMLDRGLADASVATSDSPEGIPISTAISNTKPQYVIITVGIENGVNHCTEEKFKEYYTKLILNIKESSPHTKIILQSIFPISKNTEKYNPSISNDRIDVANQYISELAKDLSVRYLNTASVLKGSDGTLDPKYDSGNWIILNEEGFRAVAQYIKTHGYK